MVESKRSKKIQPVSEKKLTFCALVYLSKWSTACLKRTLIDQNCRRLLFLCISTGDKDLKSVFKHVIFEYQDQKSNDCYRLLHVWYGHMRVNQGCAQQSGLVFLLELVS